MRKALGVFCVNLTMALIECSECKREISDKAVACPHCGAPRSVLLPEIPAVTHAEKLSASQGGCLAFTVGLIGFVLLFFFPIGTLIGIALIIAAFRFSGKIVCSNCGNKVSDSGSKICPACKALFTKPE